MGGLGSGGLVGLMYLPDHYKGCHVCDANLSTTHPLERVASVVDYSIRSS